MAISKVAQFNSTPVSTTDYQGQNAHINAFIQQMMGDQLHLTEWDTTTVPALAQGVYIAHAGILYLVDSSDYTISGSPADGDVYIEVHASGDVLVSNFITDLSDYSWNHVYNGLYDSSGYQVLPYKIEKSSTSYTKYLYSLIQRNYFDTLNTGHGDNELYAMDQNVREADSPTFARINTGQGYNELYPMDQSVKKTSTPEFESVISHIQGSVLWSASSTTITQDDFFDKFDGIIDTGYILTLHGQAEDTVNGYTYIMSFIVKNSSTTMTVYWVRSLTAGSASIIGSTLITEGSSSAFLTDIAVTY